MVAGRYSIIEAAVGAENRSLVGTRRSVVIDSPLRYTVEENCCGAAFQAGGVEVGNRARSLSRRSVEGKHYGVLIVAALIEAKVTGARAGVVDGMPAVRVRDVRIVVLDPGAVAGQRIWCWRGCRSWRRIRRRNDHLGQVSACLVARVFHAESRRISAGILVSV